jgi:hypothetical protein
VAGLVGVVALGAGIGIGVAVGDDSADVADGALAAAVDACCRSRISP